MFLYFVFVVLLLNRHVYGFGFIATSDRFPYQASLRFYYNDDHHCSATIFSNTYLLTAGHCVCCYIKYYMVYVVVGANSFVDEGQKHRIEKSICHEDFEFNQLKHDIALIKLTKPIHFSNRVQPVPLAKSAPPINGKCVFSVWGYKKEYVVTPMSFKILVGVRIDTKKCAKLYGSKMVDDTKICTITKGEGACIGDSGGPVIHKGHLVGIISFGKNCTLSYPNVHTNISAYTDWISDQLFLEHDLTKDEDY